ncbi:MAG TPA: DUF6600 domain-containing protein [Rudaea sp.]|nr:DUF6600 domain-containing protein [Rudaea sp.]
MFKSFRFALLMASALFALGAVAQPAPDQQSGDQSDPPSRVARLAYIRGTVSFVPAGENDWVEAQINRPLITGDKLWTDQDSRAELEIGSSALRLDAQTSFDFLNLDDQTAQIELTEGSLNLRVRRLYDNQVYEIDTPTLAFVINRVGEYRLTVLPNGQSTVVNVLQGGGDAYGEGGARSRIEEGQSVTFNDSGLRDYYTDSLPPPDSFDEFCRQRDGRWDHAKSRAYVSEDVIGYQDLDDNGDWNDVPEYGHVWYPTTVAVGWSPYHHGHWGWVGVYGWTWIDDAPWGFAPFHYGRWAYIGNRWGWCPGAIGVRPYYAPALVAFIGGGVSVGVAVGGPVGWFPLGPRDVYFPGYHVSQRYFTNVNVTNTVVNTTVINNYYGNYSRGDVNYTQINYANRNISGAVTAVPAAAFASARPVAASAIAVNRTTFANARVTSVAAVAPTRASLEGPGGRARAAPPAAVVNRNIVAASKPPAPVASFATREAVLQKNPGQPLTTNQLRTLPAVQNNGAGDRAVAGGASRNVEKVKVVTNTGVPASAPAAPLIARPSAGNPNANANADKRRGAGPQGGQAQNGNPAVDNSAGRAVTNAQGGRPVNAGPQTDRAVTTQGGNGREGRPANTGPQTDRAVTNAQGGNAQAGQPAGNGPQKTEHLQSSRFVNPNAGGNKSGNANAGNAADTNARGNAANGRGNAGGEGKQPVTSSQPYNNARQTNSAVTQGANAGQGNAPAYTAERKVNSSNGTGQEQNKAVQGNGREYRAPQSPSNQGSQDARVTSMPQSSVQSQRNAEHKQPQQQVQQQQQQQVQQQQVQRAPPPPPQQVQRPPPPPPQMQRQPPPQQQQPQQQQQGRGDKNKDKDKDKDKSGGGGH